MTLMTYLDPRKTIWPGLLSSVLVWVLSAAGQSQPDRGDRASGVAVHDVVDFRAHPYPGDVFVADGGIPVNRCFDGPADRRIRGVTIDYLLMGGFLLSWGMESTGAHHRIALTVVIASVDSG